MQRQQAVKLVCENWASRRSEACGCELAVVIKEKAAERDAELTLPEDFANSSNFCEDSQIKESDPSTGVPWSA